MDQSSQTDIVEKLFSSLSVAIQVAQDIRELALEEMNSYPVYVPTIGASEEEHRSTVARLAALNSMTRIFRENRYDNFLTAGILCTSDQLANKFGVFNNAKNTFVHLTKKAQRINSAPTNYRPGSFISTLLRNELESSSWRLLFDLATREQIVYNQIDLKACRSKVRILPKETDVFSWTWSSSHKRIAKVTRSDALRLAKNLADSERESAVEALALCPDNEFVKVIPLKEQLRANYVYFENGSRITKSTPLSGVVVLPQKNLPRLQWREPPSRRDHIEPRIQRVSRIHDEPFIPALSLHRYR
ncbi:hypothetical protein [uncultured Microbulbifer sp.]|uniref:hypothetical protein n=1 Tax=uncultured Microbulbifer sp. TaxID=348147 RepID=UPI002636E146|nr:hypothetical protein [uncultured Microbulbifer sp.]